MIFAFPFGDIANDQWHSTGMMLRDYFAAVALQGILAPETQVSSDDAEPFAALAYEFADAMMAEREFNDSKEKESP